MTEFASQLDAIQHLSPADQALFTQFGFGETQIPPFGCVHEAFEYYATTQPDSIAVDDFGQQITYSQLNHQANCLATLLRDSGISQDKPVCLLMERSILMIVGVVAVMKAGAGYVPLDGVVVKDDTLQHILHDSNCGLVLTLQKFAHRVQDIPVICAEDSLCQRAICVTTPLEWKSSPEDVCYTIYTSGTTGKPKGVSVMHKNVTNLICLWPGNLGMRPGLAVSQLMNLAFDMAQWEILGSLANGCTLVLRGKTSEQWRATMKRVDIVIATPSILAIHDPENYPNIKAIATAGEPCPQALADNWGRGAQFFNGCGPTEVTIVNTLQPHVPGESLSIGTPTPNNNVYILDEDMKPVPIGEVGLMWGGGACVSRGYLNLPAKTAERYQPDPFVGGSAMMFNTGDLGRWRPDGRLEHLGRIDDQVKIKGFRVELDGVTAAMQTLPAVESAVALLVEGDLYGFVTPSDVNTDEVKVAVAAIQPYYAVPKQIFALETMPLTSNGKIDKAILRNLVANAKKTDPCVAPREVVPLKVAIPQTKPESDASSSSDVSSDSSSSIVAIPPPVYKPEARATDTALVVNSGTIPRPPLSSMPSSIAEKKSTASSSEEGLSWAGYEDDELPEKTQAKKVRDLRHIVFTLYRRLFGVVFIVNMAVLISICVRGGTDAMELGKIVVANLFCAILMRQDYVINAFFKVFCSVPTSWPIAIRRVCGRVYHIGGLHSGCAISGLVWLIFFTGQATKELVEGITSVATVTITYCILALLCGIVIFAYPAMRSARHNSFEATHRFMGWSATALVWCQVISLTNDYKAPNQSLGMALTKSAPFWMVVVMTASIILPWIRLRKVPVRAEVLSNHAVKLHFDYVTPVPGSFTRISVSPLTEWHGFATVPEPGKTGYSLVVSKAGDWTSERIANPPTEMWVRGIPTMGVLRIVPLFRRLVFVATGSGIGPCAPCIFAKKVPIRLLWTSPNVRETFGDKFVDSILDSSPDAVVYDTRKYGKPDMVKLTYRLVKEFDAEAVCVISNQKLTRKIVYGMVSRGIPAFGAIWDS